jgi:metal-responsive CopG/Arc/MetJ family transcriptional regulator
VKTEYTTIHIPKVLAELIDKLVENGEFAYSSRSEFVKDAIRRFLEQYGYYPPNSQLKLEGSIPLLLGHSAKRKA